MKSPWWSIWQLLGDDWSFLGWWYAEGQQASPSAKAVAGRLALGIAGQLASRVVLVNANGVDVASAEGWRCNDSSVVSGIEPPALCL